MKKTLVFLFVFVNFNFAYAETVISDSIIESTIWSKEYSPYIVTENILVGEGIQLTITEGVVVKMYDNTQFTVNGNIEILGTENEPVIFESYSDLEESKWYSLIIDSSSNSKIEYMHIFNSDGVRVLNSEVTIKSGIFNQISLYERSKVSISDAEILNTEYPVSVYDQSELTISNTNITCPGTGISAYDGSVVVANNIHVSCNSQGIAIYDSVIQLSDSVIVDSQYFGLSYYSGIPGKESIVTRNEFSRNGFATLVYDVLIFSENNIHDNTEGVRSFIPLDLKHNWWGDPSGPYHEVHNSAALGDSVMGDEVTFYPWLTTWPPIPVYSSVALLPGFEASRLYKQGSLLNQEDQLWEPNWSTDIHDLFMNEDGISKEGIYTKDVIDQANVVVPTLKVYKTFIESMNEMVTSGEIQQFKTLPYDWRYSVLDIVNRGIVLEDGKISYENELTEDQVPFMISEIQTLADNSRNGKVTLVAHSNGGLVAKALIHKLTQMKEQGISTLIDAIDRVIMVGTPQLGTPSAVAALLHGTHQSIFGGIIMSEGTARTFGLNLPGVYGLLPSSEYFKTQNEPIIYFDKSIQSINNLYQEYGESIDSFGELTSFLLAEKDQRVPNVPEYLNQPAVINSNNNNESILFHNLIDVMDFPNNIDVIKIGGWGISTVRGINYKKKRFCGVIPLCPDAFSLKAEPVSTTDGDKTVMIKSALHGEGVNKYFNLKQYQVDVGNDDTDHKNLFEIPQIIEFVKNTLLEKSIDLEYITDTKPEAYDNMIISMHSPVSLGVYNEQGKYTGITESGENMSIVMEQIPGSTYFHFAGSKYISVPTDGVYTIVMEGEDNGYFTLDVTKYRNNTPENTITFENIATTTEMKGELKIHSGIIEEIKIDDNNDGTNDRFFEGVVLTDEIVVEEEEKSITSGFIKPEIKEKYIPIEEVKTEKEEDVIENKIESKIQNKFIKPKVKIKEIVIPSVDMFYSNTDVKQKSKNYLVIIIIFLIVMVYSIYRFIRI